MRLERRFLKPTQLTGELTLRHLEHPRLAVVGSWWLARRAGIGPAGRRNEAQKGRVDRTPVTDRQVLPDITPPFRVEYHFAVAVRSSPDGALWCRAPEWPGNEPSSPRDFQAADNQVIDGRPPGVPTNDARTYCWSWRPCCSAAGNVRPRLTGRCRAKMLVGDIANINVV
jgi:hypothetical protein